MQATKKTTLTISGMTCAACASRVEKSLIPLGGRCPSQCQSATEKASGIYDDAKIIFGAT